MSFKYNLLLVLTAGTVLMFLAMNSVKLGICGQSAYDCRIILDKTEHVFYFFPLILLFSLITLKMKESAFLAWWKFARVAIPSTFAVSFVISLGLHHSHSGWLNFDSGIDFILYIVLYAIFVIGSAVQIYRGYGVK